MSSTVGFTLNSTSPPLNIGTKTFNSSDADMTNILAWAKVVYAGIITELFGIGTPPQPVPNPTNAQIGIALATGTMRAWSQAEQKFRQDTASAAVPPVPPASWA